MLLISRFESYLKMCGFEMGCDKKMDLKSNRRVSK